MSSTRRLAAILFADIVGYTALMQRDERLALACLQQFKRELEIQVAAHRGEIIQYYGDACLVIFQSAVDAVLCSISLQKAFRQNPEVPVRIGLHSGEVVLQENNVFGDAVNIASRVESMGVPGAVLCSSSIQNQIKNQEEFRLVSLGRFEFKNVEGAMTVYALANEGLAVPRPEAVSGKLKEKSPKEGPVRKPVIWLVLAALGVLAAGISLWQQRWSDGPLLPAEIREARIAVLPYDNNTNDTTLNVLGNMAADCITRNLMNLQGVRIVQFDQVREHLDLLQGRLARFAEQTGAERLIRGRFYQEGGDLIFESHIMNPASSEVVYVLPLIRGHREKPSELVSELSQRVAGYFALRKNDMIGFSVAPRYEAFVAYEHGLKYFGRDDDKSRALFREAMEKDSNFLFPFIFHAITYSNQGQLAIADSLLKNFKERFSSFPRPESFFLGSATALIEGDIQRTYSILKEWLSVDPKSFALNYQFGNTALSSNRPQSTVDAYRQLDAASMTFDIPMKHWWFEVYAQALIRLGKLEEAQKMIRMVPADVNPEYLIRQRIFTLQNRPDSLEQLIREMESRAEPEYLIVDALMNIAIDYAIQGDRSRQKAWAQRAIDRIEKSAPSAPFRQASLAAAYYFSEDYEKALSRFQSLIEAEGESPEHLIRLGCTHGRLGDRERALECIRKLSARETKYSHGYFKYAQSQVYAALGEREKAVELMKQAFREGCGFEDERRRYSSSFEFIPLHGYAPFEEFVRPK